METEYYVDPGYVVADYVVVVQPVTVTAVYANGYVSSVLVWSPVSTSQTAGWSPVSVTGATGNWVEINT
jgi:hypothetical protein